MKRRLAVVFVVMCFVAVAVLSGCSERRNGKEVTGPSEPEGKIFSGNESPDESNVFQGIEGYLPGQPPTTYPDAPPVPSFKKGGSQADVSDVMGVPGWRILQETYSWLGVSYLYGGNSRSGIDCSHLVYQVYRNVGIPYPYFATWQMKTSYRFVCVNPVPGDIIVFRYLNHCGIYIGNGWMVDANSYTGKVQYDYIWDSYWSQQGPYAIRFIG